MDEDSLKEKDDFFVGICYEAIKRTTGNCILPLLVFSLYTGLRLFFRGNADTGLVTYTQLIWIFIISIVLLFLHGVAIMFHLSDINNKRIRISIKRIFLSMSEGLTSLATYIVILIYGYCAIDIGLMSLLDFKYGFSIFPIIKVVVFTILGLWGILNITHFIKLQKLLTVKGDISNEYIRFELQDRAMQYIMKYDLLNENTKKKNENNN